MLANWDVEVEAALDSHEKIKLLIQSYFLSGQREHTRDPGDDIQRRRVVEEHLQRLTRPHGDAALALVAAVRGVVLEVEGSALAGSRSRFFHRIDASSLRKSPKSILDKMVRSRDPDAGEAPSFDLDLLTRKMNDLGRFRVVVNFLSDLEAVSRAIRTPYLPAASRLTPAQQELASAFLMREDWEDKIHLPPNERTTGERCHKATFIVRGGSLKGKAVELQLQTQLQEAWDKKDHFLIYEPRRDGRQPSPDHEREMFAMSELLFVADLTFDRLRQAVREGSTQDSNEGRNNATS